MIEIRLVGIDDGSAGAIVYTHRMTGQAILFFDMAIHDVEGLDRLGRHTADRLLEQIPHPFQLLSLIALNELGQIGNPQIHVVWIAEDGYTFFIGLEGFLKVLILLMKDKEEMSLLLPLLKNFVVYIPLQDTQRNSKRLEGWQLAVPIFCHRPTWWTGRCLGSPRDQHGTPRASWT